MSNGPIIMNTASGVRSLAFLKLQDSLRLLSANDQGVVQQWSVDNGREVGQAMNMGSLITAMTLSPNEKWLVCTGFGVATVWNMETHQRAYEPIRDHTHYVDTVHVDSDSKKFATGSNDRRVFIYNIETGAWVLRRPLEHDDRIGAVRFSPDGKRIAVGGNDRLRIYSMDTSSDLLMTIPIPTASFPNTPVLWYTPHSLFALSGNTLFYLDADSGQIFSCWTVPGTPVDHHGSIALARNGKFIAATAGNSISLWDTSTFARITSSPVIQHPSQLWSIAISFDVNYLASSRGGEITVRRLGSIIPRYYLADQQPLRDGDDPTRVPDGRYCIRINASDLYLTAPQSGTGTVFVKPLDQSDASQRWNISLIGNGAYNIMGSSNAPLSVGVRNSLVIDRRGTAWNFDPRGNAYVIGNAVNATAIQLAPNRRSVSVFPRNSSAQQRWFLEPV